MSFIGNQDKVTWPSPKKRGADAHVAQLVERVLGKDEVISSILIMGSSDPGRHNAKINSISI